MTNDATLQVCLVDSQLAVTRHHWLIELEVGHAARKLSATERLPNMSQTGMEDVFTTGTRRPEGWGAER
jgi:hypothetical protein